MLLVPVLLVGGAGWIGLQKIAGDVQRIPHVFERMPAGVERPTKPAPGSPGAESVTFLVGGLDRRSDAPTTGGGATEDLWVPGAARTDSIMVVHLTSDRKRAYVISIPRDSWVPIPGYGRDKINAAFSYGGPSLYVATVEQLTGLRIDHLAIIDWIGFARLTDALGGVELTFSGPTVTRGRTWPAGTHRLTGEEALDYVGERKRIPGGDFGRVNRQQNFLRALMRQLSSASTLTSPSTLADAIGAVTSSVSVDDGFSNTEMIRLALSLRGLRPSDVTFLTVPTQGVGRAGRASIVVYDYERARSLWAAVGADNLEEWLAANPNSTLPRTVQ